MGKKDFVLVTKNVFNFMLIFQIVCRARLKEQAQPAKCREKIKQQLKLYDGGPRLNKGKLK